MDPFCVTGRTARLFTAGVGILLIRGVSDAIGEAGGVVIVAEVEEKLAGVVEVPLLPLAEGQLKGRIAFCRNLGEFSLLLFDPVLKLLDHAVLVGKRCVFLGECHTHLCQHRVAGGEVVREGCCGWHASNITRLPSGRKCQKKT